jgi:hypothetical protein
VIIYESAANQLVLTISESIGLLALKNPRVTFGIGFVNNFGDGSGSVFNDFFYVNKGWAR